MYDYNPLLTSIIITNFFNNCRTLLQSNIYDALFYNKKKKNLLNSHNKWLDLTRLNHSDMNAMYTMNPEQSRAFAVRCVLQNFPAYYTSQSSSATQYAQNRVLTRLILFKTRSLDISAGSLTLLIHDWKLSPAATGMY